MITANGVRKQILPYLLFPGDNTAAIPQAILETDNSWGNFSPNGWMDTDQFQLWMLKFISEINRCKASDQTSEYMLLLLDGHSS